MSRSDKNTRPNLVFVFSDQQSFDMLGCYGNDQIRTPHLDRLAAEGVRFTAAFANSPLCTPCRGTLLTGMHPLYHGAVDNEWPLIPTSDSFCGVLSRQGYRTGYVGKWHLQGGYRERPIPAGDNRLGFDTFLSNNCAVDFRPGHAFYYDQDHGEKRTFNVWEPHGQTAQAIEFLDTCVDGEPFGLFLSLHPPHDHLGSGNGNYYQAPAEHLSGYQAAQPPLRPGTEDNAKHREMLEGHMALCSSVDDCVGEIISKLDEMGCRENTLVVFTSDHGDMLRYEGGERLIKSRPEATSSHVPLIMRMPAKFPANATHNAVFSHLDTMPTILGLLGIDVPKACQGLDESSRIATKNPFPSNERPLFMQNATFNWRGVVTDEFIYAYAPFEEKTALSCNVLYRWREDPYCQRNHFNDPSLAPTRERLHRDTLSWMKSFHDPLMETSELLELCFPDVTHSGGMIPWDDPAVTPHHSARPVDLISASTRRTET